MKEQVLQKIGSLRTFFGWSLDSEQPMMTTAATLACSLDQGHCPHPDRPSIAITSSATAAYHWRSTSKHLSLLSLLQSVIHFRKTITLSLRPSDTCKIVLYFIYVYLSQNFFKTSLIPKQCFHRFETVEAIRTDFS